MLATVMTKEFSAMEQQLATEETYRVTGVSCLDCAGEFEREVAAIPGVQRVNFNAVLGILTVEGTGQLLEKVRDVGLIYHYTVDPASRGRRSGLREFRVDGITCLDCARKFEQAVSELPGVTGATLQLLTGKLIVEGAADLVAIQQLGKCEGYAISAFGAPPQRAAVQRFNWELVRAAGAGIGLAFAFAFEQAGAAAAMYLPLYFLVVIAGGWGNFHKAGLSLRRFNFNMSVLMSIAVVGAFGIGQFEEGASVAFLFALSEVLERWTMERSRRSIHELMTIAPKTARVRYGATETEVPVEEIVVGDVVVIRPGEKIAMDGEIMAGSSAVQQAAITGESLPVEKERGDEVFAGTLNTYGALEIRVTKLVEDTAIAKIIHMVEEAQGKRAPLQSFVEKFAAVYTPVVIGIAAVLVVVPPLLLGQDWQIWLYRALTLLVVSCPCALVVSTPIAIVSAISNAAKHGVLIKGGVYLEQLGGLSAVAFDKTGTLTYGEPEVTDVIALSRLQGDEILSWAASLEARSEHPVAAAIVNAAQARGCPLLPVADFSAIPGQGIQGQVAGQRVYVGNLRFFANLGVNLDGRMEHVTQLQQQGKTIMLVGSVEELWGIVALADQIRPEIAPTVAMLKRSGIQHTIMLTGDHAVVAQNMANQAGIDEFRADLLPEHKVAAVHELIGQYGKVAMVGDGINDAPALAAATVGIAMGGAGSDTALETADIVLMADDLRKLPYAIRLSHDALAIIRQNIAFALGLKIIAVLGVFPGWLTLWLAIVADMGATIIVTFNSLRLLRDQGAR